MTSQGTASTSLLDQATHWGNIQRESLLVPYISTYTQKTQEAEQGPLFHEDGKRLIHTFSTQTQYELASLAQSITTLVLAPLTLFAEVYRLCNRSINASTCLKNISTIPKHIFQSLFTTVCSLAQTADVLVSAASTGVGFLIWHGGEKLVRAITKSPHTVLSNQPQIRDIVYHSLGLTLLAAGAVFIPIAPIQMIALPIILGSIYGTINNQFSVRECPEYYTMGHYYDGTDLKGHAIKTNNLLIKPIVTGCYATTMVTKLAGIVLAAAGTLPYTAAMLPVSLAGAMISGTCAIALVAAHLFSTLKKRALEKTLREYASLTGLEWNEANISKRWDDLAQVRNKLIKQKRHELSSHAHELTAFDQKLKKLTQTIESNILNSQLPVKYIVGWQANNTRNSIGYLFAGGGTVAIAITTVFLRLFAV